MNSSSYPNRSRRCSFFALLLVAAGWQFAGCSKGFVGKTFVSDTGTRYVRFVNDMTLEWLSNKNLGPAVFDYYPADGKIRVEHREGGLYTVHYLTIIDTDTLADELGTRYHLRN